MYKILTKLFLIIALSQGSIIPGHDVDDTNIGIVGGEPAPDGAVPYQISMRHGASEKHICGGSIIDKRWILSAAHCVVQASPQNLKIVVGTNLLNSGGAKYAVERVIVHESYDKNTIENDIALLKLTKDIDFNEKVKPIGLPTSDTADGVTLLLSGWGKTTHPGQVPNELQWIQLKSISVQECKTKNGELLPVTEKHLCTFTQRGQGACHGDSGGPLAQGNEVVGVVSWGKPCAVGNPDVFTRVYKYKDWIIKNMH